MLEFFVCLDSLSLTDPSTAYIALKWHLGQMEYIMFYDVSFEGKKPNKINLESQ